MSTPRSVELPDGVRHSVIRTSRGTFAALEARPAHGVCERQAALLVPGYTGSKEDFLAVLDQLATAGRRVIAIDMRGQYQTPGRPVASGTDPYSPAELGADVAGIMRAIGARHLVGHSFGGLVARETLLNHGGTSDLASSFTLMSSGPGALGGSRADELKGILATLDETTPGLARGTARPDRDIIAELWRTSMEPQARAAGVAEPVIAFLRERMLSSDPAGLTGMARYLLTAPDRTGELAQRSRQLPILVLYGEDDNAWAPAVQEDMARRLAAERICVPGAAHSPCVEAPATTASTLTRFWNTVEG